MTKNKLLGFAEIVLFLFHQPPSSRLYHQLYIVHACKRVGLVAQMEFLDFQTSYATQTVFSQITVHCSNSLWCLQSRRCSVCSSISQPVRTHPAPDLPTILFCQPDTSVRAPAVKAVLCGNTRQMSHTWIVLHSRVIPMEITQRP